MSYNRSTIGSRVRPSTKTFFRFRSNFVCGTSTRYVHHCHLDTIQGQGHGTSEVAKIALFYVYLFMIPWTRLSLKPKRHHHWFSRFCTAHGRKCLYFTVGTHFPQIAPYQGGIWTLSNLWFLGLVRAQNPNGITTGSTGFAQMTRVSPYFTMGRPSPFKIALSHGCDDLHLIHGSLGPPEFSTQMASRSFQPLFAGLTSVTDRHTIGCIYTYGRTTEYCDAAVA